MFKLTVVRSSTRHSRWVRRAAIRAAALLLALAAPGVAEELSASQQATLSRHFGFAPMQIYKIKPGIDNLRLADVDADGRTDILLWNSYENRIEIFRKPRTGETPTNGAALERNEIPDRGDLYNEHVPVSYRIADLQVAELTGDDRPDIVFFGEPRELVVLPGKPEGGFGAPMTIRASEGDARSGTLCIGDFNTDGRTDVALLGADALLLFHQRPAGGLEQPQRLAHKIPAAIMMLPADINNDQRLDLVIAVDDDRYGAYVMLQSTDGTLSATQRVRIPKLRSMTFAKNAQADDLFTIQAVTGRLTQSRWQDAPASAAAAEWPQHYYAFPSQIRSKRFPVAVGDLTHDGLDDVVVADPDAARLILFVQRKTGLRAGQTFPGMQKTTDLTIADIDGDGRNELLSTSAEEKSIGLSRFENDRLSYPAPLPTTGKPLAIAVGKLSPAEANATSMAYIGTEDRKARLRMRRHGEPDGRAFDLDALDDDADGLRVTDVNQDGRHDLVLFQRFSDPIVLVNTDSDFTRLTGAEARAGLLRDGRRPGSGVFDIDGDGKREMLLAQKTFARALRVEDGKWVVVDQFNPDSPNVELTGLAAYRSANGQPTVLLYNRQDATVLALQPKEGTFRQTAAIPTINMDLNEMRTLTTADGRQAILLIDSSGLLLLAPDRPAPRFVSVHEYASKTRDAWLGDVVIGDVNHDGIRDVAAIDMRLAAIELLTTMPSGAFAKALRFQVFQGKRFSDRPDSSGEPREVLIGDVTHDGIDDVVLIVHDRLIVYPGQ